MVSLFKSIGSCQPLAIRLFLLLLSQSHRKKAIKRLNFCFRKLKALGSEIENLNLDRELVEQLYGKS